jgi:hypothetical protein
LAVETSKIFPGEVQDLYPNLINSETTASFFSHGDSTYSDLQLLGVMIYDIKTGISSAIRAIYPLTLHLEEG